MLKIPRMFALVIAVCGIVSVLSVACADKESVASPPQAGNSPVVKTMTSADFEVRPVFGMFAGPFPDGEQQTGIGYAGVRMQFKIWTSDYPVTEYSGLGVLAITTDPEGEDSVTLEEEFGFNQGEPGGESPLLEISGLEFGSVTRIFITANELVDAEENPTPFHINTITTLAGPVNRVEVYSTAEAVAIMAGEGHYEPEWYDEAISAFSHAELERGETRHWFIRAYDSEDRVVSHQPFYFGFEGEGIVLSSDVSLPEEEVEEETHGTNGGDSEGPPQIDEFTTWSYISLFPQSDQLIPVIVSTNQDADGGTRDALSAVNEYLDESIFEMSTGVPATRTGSIPGSIVATYSLNTTNTAQLTITANTTRSVASPVGQVTCEAWYDWRASTPDWVNYNVGLRQSPFFTWYSDLSQSPTPGDWFRFKLDGDLSILNDSTCVVEWELYTYDWINGVVALNPQTSSSSTGHQMTWVSPPWPFSTTPAAAVWFLNVNVTFGNNTWRHPVYYMIQPQAVVPIRVIQFPGNIRTQTEWDAAISRANEIYMGSAIRFTQSGSLENQTNTFVGISFGPVVLPTPFIEPKSTTLGQILQDWSTTYPPTDNMTRAWAYREQSSTQWWVGYRVDLGTVPFIDSLKTIVESTTPALAGELDVITVYTGIIGVFGGAAMGADEYWSAVTSTSLGPQGGFRMPHVPLYDLFGSWSNTIALDFNTPTVTDARSEFAHNIGKTLGLFEPFYLPVSSGQQPQRPALADRLLMDPERGNSSSQSLPASTYRGQAYKVAREIMAGLR